MELRLADDSAAEEITIVRRTMPVAARAHEETRVEIDLGAVTANARAVSRLVGPTCGLLAMLKADAYGHGLLPVARALEERGDIAGIVVTTPKDALALRRAGISAPVIVLATSYGSAHAPLLAAGVTPVLGSLVDLDAFARAARASGRRASVHVKLDTGMSRLGLREDEIAPFLDVAARAEIAITGLCTHLADADGEDPWFTRRQLTAFHRGCARFRAGGHRPTMIHVANTAGVFRHPEARFTHVRTGIALFGGDTPSGARLEPTLRLLTTIARVRRVGAGETVSYGARWRASRPSRIAILPVGYAHGYPRGAFGRGEVLIGGRRRPIVGAICMESMLVDVTDSPAVAAGDEAVLVGDAIRTTDIAELTGGLVEELLCRIPASIPRHYIP